MPLIFTLYLPQLSEFSIAYPLTFKTVATMDTGRRGAGVEMGSIAPSPKLGRGLGRGQANFALHLEFLGYCGHTSIPESIIFDRFKTYRHLVRQGKFDRRLDYFPELE
jgi:hypothetical protein